MFDCDPLKPAYQAELIHVFTGSSGRYGSRFLLPFISETLNCIKGRICADFEKKKKKKIFTNEKRKKQNLKHRVFLVRVWDETRDDVVFYILYSTQS